MYTRCSTVLPDSIILFLTDNDIFELLELSSENTSHIRLHSAGNIFMDLAGTGDIFEVTQAGTALSLFSVGGDGDVGIGTDTPSDA